MQTIRCTAPFTLMSGLLKYHIRVRDEFQHDNVNLSELQVGCVCRCGINWELLLLLVTPSESLDTLKVVS